MKRSRRKAFDSLFRVARKRNKSYEGRTTSDSLSAGEKVGIGLGASCGFVAIIVCLWFCCCQPKQPKDLEINVSEIKDKETTCTVKWNPHLGTRVKQTFELQFREQGTKKQCISKQFVCNAGVEKKQPMTNLMPLTTYDIRVCVVRYRRRSSFTPLPSVDTIDKPKHIYVTQIKDTEIKFTVTLNPCSDNQLERMFYLQYKDEKTKEWSRWKPYDCGVMDTIEVPIQKLKSLTSYEIAGYVTKGPLLTATEIKAPFTQTFWVTTSGQPTNSKCPEDEISDTTILATWDHENEEGLIQTFIPCIREEENDKWEEKRAIIHKNGQTQQRFTDLKPSTCYVIKLIYFKSKEKSEDTGVRHIKTKGKPDIPENFKCSRKETSDTTIFVTWDPGDDGGLRQTFIPCIREEHDKWEQTRPIIHTMADTQHQFTHLQPSTCYEIKLFAFNSIGNSEDTDVLYIKTKDEKHAGNKTNTAIASHDLSTIQNNTHQRQLHNDLKKANPTRLPPLKNNKVKTKITEEIQMTSENSH